MTRTRVLLLGLLLGACAVPQPAPVAPIAAAAELSVCRADPQGGRLADRGIGGTGRAAGPRGAETRLSDRGIGGTGGPAIGVLGTITGFASVCTAGLEIAVDAADAVSIDGIAAPGDSLRVGQVTAITAGGDATGLRARAIAVLHEVSGPVEDVAEAGRMLTVAGQPVRITATTSGETAVGPGDWVAVSGLRNADGQVMASRIDRRTPGEVLVTGRLTTQGQRWHVGSLRVIPPAGSVPQSAGSRRRVTLIGRYSAAGLTVRSLTVQPALPFPDGVRRFVVEGFVRAGGLGVRIGQDLDVAVGPEFGAVTTGTALEVVDLEVSANGTLVATGHRDSTGDRTGMAAPTTAVAAAHAAAVAAAAHASAATAAAAAHAATVATAAAAAHAASVAGHAATATGHAANAAAASAAAANSAAASAAAARGDDKAGAKGGGDKASDKGGGDRGGGGKCGGGTGGGYRGGGDRGGGDRGGDKGGRR